MVVATDEEMAVAADEEMVVDTEREPVVILYGKLGVGVGDKIDADMGELGVITSPVLESEK